MSDTQKIERPRLSGPGSERALWVAYAAQELDMSPSEFEDDKEWTRAKLIELVDSREGEHEDGTPSGVRMVPETDATKLREAPEGVEVFDSPKAVTDALGRRAWATPVEGGYAAEAELTAVEVRDMKPKAAK